MLSFDPNHGELGMLWGEWRWFENRFLDSLRPNQNVLQSSHTRQYELKNHFSKPIKWLQCQMQHGSKNIIHHHHHHHHNGKMFLILSPYYVVGASQTFYMY